METEQISKRWSLICGEIQYRWPDLPMEELSLEKMPSQLEVLLTSHYHLCRTRAIREANRFWDELGQSLQQAAA
jgi:hypothetical protein